MVETRSRAIRRGTSRNSFSASPMAATRVQRIWLLFAFMDVIFEGEDDHEHEGRDLKFGV
jgi:hypothetical protein